MKRVLSIAAAACAASVALLAPGAEAQCYVPAKQVCLTTAATTTVPAGLTDLRVYTADAGLDAVAAGNVTVANVTLYGSNTTLVSSGLDLALDSINTTSASYYSSTGSNVTWCAELNEETNVERVQLRNASGVNVTQYVTLVAANTTVMFQAAVMGPSTADAAVFATMATVSASCPASALTRPPSTWTPPPRADRNVTAPPMQSGYAALVVAQFTISVTIGQWAAVELLTPGGVDLLAGVVFSTADEAAGADAAALGNEYEDDADTFDAVERMQKARATRAKAQQAQPAARGMGAKAVATFTENLGGAVQVSSLTVFGPGATGITMADESGASVFSATEAQISSGGAFTLETPATFAPGTTTTAAPGGGSAAAYGSAATVAAAAGALLALLL